MKLLLKLGLTLIAGLSMNAQPRAVSLVNSASYMPSGLPNSGIAQGAIFVIFGEGLGPSAVTFSPQIPLDTQVAGTSVRIESGGRTYSAPLVYTSATQIAGIFPSPVPEGAADVIVTYGGADSNRLSVQVRKAAFGIFTQNQAGFGPAILQNWNNGRVSLNGLHSVITAGQLAILWGTGLGAISQSDADVPPAGDLATEVQVLVGGLPAEVQYHGRSPSYPGLDQINFKIPPGITGCYVPIAVRAGGVLSNFASISIVSSGTACGDDVSWRGRLFTGATGANVRVGIVEMTHEQYSSPTGPPVFWTETGEAHFFDVLWKDINQLSRLSDLQLLPGTCTMIWNRWSTTEGRTSIYPEIPSLILTPIRAGDYLKIQSPQGVKSLEHSNPGEYEGHLGGLTELGGVEAPRFMTAGTYTFDNAAPPPAPGQTTTPPESYDLKASLTISSEIQWTNKSQITGVSRSEGLRFDWSGGLDSREYVLVGGSSADEALQTRVTFACAEKPSKGTFTAPAWILEAMPRSSTSASDSYPNGFVFLGRSSNNVNSLASDVVLGTLNMLYFRYRFMDYSTVDFQ